MKQNAYQKANLDITIMVDEAKRRNGFDDAAIAKRIDMAAGSLSNSRCSKTMSKFQFWRVMLIAELAGYQVKFVKKGEAS